MLIRLLRQLGSGLSRRRDPDVPKDEQLALAVKMHRGGRLPEAEAAYRSLLEHNPDDHAILNLLGHCLTRQNRPDEAVEVLSRASAINPGSAETLFNLAMARKSQGAFAPALAGLREALQLNPGFVEAHLNAAELCMRAGDYTDAESHFRSALAAAPEHAEAHYNFGVFLYNMGRSPEAIAGFRRAGEIKPGFALAHGFLVAAVSGAPGYTAAEIFREQRSWASRFADPLAPAAARYQNAPGRRRRLRIGYVSPDLRSHPIANFFEPLLARHDHAEFEICCYYTAKVNDAENRRLRALADRWVDCAEMADDALVRQIVNDRVDILVDLSAHTKNNHLPVFARRPAPVQVSYLGYPTSTGIAAIDYRISDHALDPDGMDPYSAEQVVRLPDTYYCYRPPENLPEIGPVPAARKGYVTFGCFNNLVKLDQPTIRLWAKIMQELPTAKLFLKTRLLANVQVRQSVAARFAQEGIDESRLIMQGWEAQTESHLSHYNEVDIALDPTAYNGATTTCEALLMGVPVVTLSGDTHLSRLGASLLTAVGLPELIVATGEIYVEKCVALARDLPALEKLRKGLRAQMRASALMDEVRFTRAFEREYRNMWVAWCEQQAQSGG